MDRQQFGDYVAAWEKEAHKRTWRFLSAFERAIPPKCFHLVQGDPGVVIPHFAKEHAVDLVVMGTLGRLGTHGMFIGDTAERVLNQLECSVLALKPSGFVSPIRLA
jgi:nucleotide-binding universal stress UspA family protein